MRGVLRTLQQEGPFLKAFLKAAGEVFSLAHLAVVRIRPFHWFSERANYFAAGYVLGDPLARCAPREVIWAKFSNWAVGRTVTKVRSIPFQAFVVVPHKEIGFLHAFGQSDVTG